MHHRIEANAGARPGPRARRRLSGAVTFGLVTLLYASRALGQTLSGSGASPSATSVPPPAGELTPADRDAQLATAEVGMRTRAFEARPVVAPAAVTLVGAGWMTLFFGIAGVAALSDALSADEINEGPAVGFSVALAPLGAPFVVVGAIWWADRADTRRGLDVERRRLNTTRIVPMLTPLRSEGAVRGAFVGVGGSF